MRLFTAICLDEKAKNALQTAAEEAKSVSEGNFTIKENYHLTLVFIGETERKEDIISALEEIEFPEFDFEISGTGTFEKGIFFAKVKENEKLSGLYEIIAGKLRENGFEIEERKFVPHITLARKHKAPEGFNTAKTEELLPKGRIKARSISLMKSERIDGVLRYTEIFSRNLF